MRESERERKREKERERERERGRGRKRERERERERERAPEPCLMHQTESGSVDSMTSESDAANDRKHIRPKQGKCNFH